MIIPSIDIQEGRTVQLIGGKELAIDSGDPRPLAEKFGRVGEIAVIDLCAAKSTGSNADLIKSVLPLAECRVGGGIRDVQTAINWLDAGAAKVIIGTAAEPELLEQLPKERVIVALDAVHSDDGSGAIVDQGWTNQTGQSVLDRIVELRDLVGGFLITFVEREGRMTGIDLDTIKQYREAASQTKITAAGGVATVEEIAELDRLGLDAQIGMALYTKKISLAGSIAATLKSDRPDGLWPTVVTSETGQALGLAYSNAESLDRSLETGDAHYWSRKRGLWRKGATSGATQKVISVVADCDRDTLKFVVQQQGVGFCHLEQTTCFGNVSGIASLESTLHSRMESAPAGSYTKRLFESDELLNAKIVEEANELCDAKTRNELVHEAADVLFFTMAKMVKNGIGLRDIELELDHRSKKVSRRPGNAKTGAGK